MNRKEQKIEAIKRMKMLQLHENPIREFDKEDVVNQSEHGGMLYAGDYGCLIQLIGAQ